MYDAEFMLYINLYMCFKKTETVFYIYIHVAITGC